MRQVWLLVAKDVRLEWRNREMAAGFLVYALILLVVFGFAFDPTRTDLRPVFGGILWIGFFFSAMLGITRVFSVEYEEGALLGLRMAPVDRSLILASKFLVNLLFMAALEIVVVPLFFVFLQVPDTAPFWSLAAVIGLGTVGFLAIGTLLSAITANVRMGHMLFPLAMFPLLVPAILGGVEGTSLLLGHQMQAAWAWIHALIGYDVLFVAAAFVLADYLLEV